jgi:hypothetical protein
MTAKKQQSAIDQSAIVFALFPGATPFGRVEELLRARKLPPVYGN